MSATCVVGLQWGDEAKGKFVDWLTAEHDIVVRYQGGANAGHTIVFDGRKFKLSLIPGGIFHPNVQSVVAGGVVLDPASFLGEIDGLTEQGIAIGNNLIVSDRAHLIFPWHKEEDRLMNDMGTSGEAIGTTMRGIGPCYRDKLGRSLAVRVGDLFRDDFLARIEKITVAKNRYLPGLVPAGSSETVVPFDAAAIGRQYAAYAEHLRPYVADTTAFLLDAVDADRKILFEGAQGALLDIDHGTFPFVTSSNSSGVGIPAGAGVPPRFLTRVLGVMKAYTTRVGGGPFPTELDNAIGQKIRDRGNEYGTVTKRPRRCGWFDAVAARYTARLGGATELAVTLLDVLSTFETIQVCTAYELDGKRTTHFPSHVEDLRRVVPIYESHPGWSEEITAVKSFGDLPEKTRRYVARLAELVGVPVSMVSVGPSRDQTIRVA